MFNISLKQKSAAGSRTLEVQVKKEYRNRENEKCEAKFG